MNVKNKIFIILLMLTFVFSVSIVCAEDNSLTQNDEIILSVENPSETPDANSGLEITQSNLLESVDEGDNEKLELRDSDNNDSLSVNANDKLKSSEGTFSELQELINSASDTITLEKDYTYNLETDSSITEGIIINKDLTILGNNHTLDGSNQSAIFKISDSSITIKDLIFINADGYDGGAVFIGNDGDIVLNIVFDNCKFKDNAANYGGAISIEGQLNFNMSNCDFVNNSAADEGGAICIYYADDSNFTIMNCNFMNNSANDDGGAIYIYDADDSNFTIMNCNFVNNSANDDGGAIYTGSSLDVENSTFISNFADNEGGCIFFDHMGDGTIIDSTFVDNYAYDGGALYFDFIDTMMIDNSSFINNHASDQGGAINYYFMNGDINLLNNSVFINNTAYNGGAVYVSDESNLNAYNTLFFNNSATDKGGAMCLDPYNYIDVSFCTFIHNSALNGGAICFESIAWESNAITYSIFDNNTAQSGKDIKLYAALNRPYVDSFNYWGMNFTSEEECINSDIYNYKGRSICPDDWVLMSIYGNDPLKVGYNESFTVVFDKICTYKGAIDNFTGVLPDYWTSVYVYEGADYNHEWDNENLDAGEFITNIWLRNNEGTFYFTPDKAIPYTFRTHSPFTNWEEAVFETHAILPAADLEISKSVSPKVVIDGNTVVWTITVTNNGPDIAFNAYVDDVLPEGLTYVTSSASNGSYSNSTGKWIIGDLSNGETVTLNITTIVGKYDSITNVAFVNSSTEDVNMSNNYGNDTVNVTFVADLNVTKEVSYSVETVRVGDTLTYTITVKNNGPSNATAVKVVDEIDTSMLKLINATCDGEAIDFTGEHVIPFIANGSSSVIVLTVEVINNGTIRNGVVVNGSEYDPNETDNEDNATDVEADPVADLTVAKSVSEMTVKAGDTVTWTITVTNNGPCTARNAIVNDILPEGLTYQSSSASQGSYDSTSGVWSIGNLTNGETVTLTITTVVGDVEGIVNNHVNVSSDTEDPDMSNNEADESITVIKDPEQPDEPVVPEEPVIPEVPDEPVVPDEPEVPEEPSVPEEPEESVTDEVMVKSVNYKAGNPVMLLAVMFLALVFLPKRKIR